jgi:hypothetical protein
MDVHRVDHVPRIVTRHRDCDGHAGGATEVQHQAISRSKALLRQSEPPQTNVALGVGAGKIDREFGLRSRKRVANAPFQCIKIVDVAGFFANRKIPGAMNRKSERGRIVCQDRCGAITLVNFAI